MPGWRGASLYRCYQVPCTESLLSSSFSRSRSTKNPLAEVGGKDDAFGNRKLRRHVRRKSPHMTFHTSPSESVGQGGKEERRRATPNSQPTGCIDIVPREWASGTTLAISRPGNCFAASRKVNDTRCLSKHTAEYHFVTPRIPVTESLSTVSLPSRGKGSCPACLLVVTKQSTLSPPAFFLAVFTANRRGIGTVLDMHLHASNSLLTTLLIVASASASASGSQSRSRLVLGMRKYLTNTTTHARSNNVSRCCATGRYDSFRGSSTNSSLNSDGPSRQKETGSNM